MRFLIIVMMVNILGQDCLYGQPAWEIVNEGYTGPFTSVAFINSQTGWISGGKGLLKTLDGGVHWTRLEENTGWFEKISFYNDSVGWAFNEVSYSLQKTTDGGRTWTHHLPNQGEIKDIQVISDQVIYVFGEAICRSTDGGETWQEIVPYLQEEYYTSFFLDENKGVVVTDKNIYRTTDGWKSWRTKPHGFSDNIRIGLINDSIGYLSSAYVTTDMFETWTSVPIPSASGAFHVTAHGTMLAVSNQFSFGFGSFSNLKIVRSTDKGNTWQSIPNTGIANDCTGRSYFDEIITNTGESVILFISCPGPYCQVLKSTDDGKSWTSAGMKFSFPLYNIQFVNREKGFVSGGESIHYGLNYGMLLQTADQGRHWQVSGSSSGTISSFYFLNETTGYLSGSEYSTFDGGESWGLSDLQPAGKGEGMFSLNDSVAWRFDFFDYLSSPAIKSESLFKTVDGGYTWDTICYQVVASDDQYNSIQSLYVKKSNEGYAVAGEGLILKFAEVGCNVEVIPSGTTLPLHKIVFPDQEHGLITGGYHNSGGSPEGFSAIMLTSGDGGDHWTNGPDLPYLIHDMVFTDSLQGFAAGEDHGGLGVLLETTDRGAHWNRVPLEDDLLGPLRALSYKDGIGWAAGEDGTILKYDTRITGGKDLAVHQAVDLLRNYPNPFCQRTMIHYRVAEADMVIMNIYDLSGRRVATPVCELESKGMYELEWDATGMGEGIYFCELQTGPARQVIKMCVIR